jgi:lantibiotic modifying enzyme
MHSSKGSSHFGVLKSISEYLERCISNVESPGLFRGKAGISLFFFLYSRLKDDKRYLDVGNDILSESIDQLSQSAGHYNFSDGLSGVGWILQFLINKEYIDEDADELLQKYDQLIFESSLHELKKGRYDYVHQALGSIVYFLERASKSDHRLKFEYFIGILITELLNHAVVSDDGIKWYDRLSPGSSERINFGLAHGIPSIIAILSLSSIHVALRPSQKKNIRAAVEFINSFNGNGGSRYSLFPTVLFTRKEDSILQSRLGWCYGDLGVALSFLHAYLALNDRNIFRVAIEIAAETTKRFDENVTGIIDGGLCHGSAGVSCLYSRFYQVTGIDLFKNQSNFWMDKTVTYQSSDSEGAGYKFFQPNGMESVPFLLDGAAGVGLSIIGYLDSKLADWDRCLLIS